MKALAYASCRIPEETAEVVREIAQSLGVTVSAYTRSLLEREAACLGKSCVTGQAALVLDSATRLRQKAAAAAQDGRIDPVERGELTQIEAQILSALWGDKEAA